MFVIGCVQGNKAGDACGNQSEEKAETAFTHLLILKKGLPEVLKVSEQEG